MRISYEWLKEYVDVRLPPQELAERLSMAGLSVESIVQAGVDSFLEIEITSNRPDWLSLIGVGREVAALTGGRLKVPQVHIKQSVGRQANIPIRIDDRDLCPRYTGRIITDVSIAHSPAWLKTRVEAMAQRSVNNVVDITNFCLFETGEPMHAFDLDKIAGKELIVRRATKGEKIITIDGVERTLDNDTLIIADSQKPIAIAGVMGGRDTEVTAATKNILLEAAYFDPLSVRRTSRKLGLSTESSYRFERRVDIENIVCSSDRATALIADIAGGKVGELTDIGKPHKSEKTIEIRFKRMNDILGLDMDSSKAMSILHALGLETKNSSKDGASMKAPSFRYDLQNEVDLIEEISRVYGYDRIGQTIPAIVEQPVRLPDHMVVCRAIRQALASFGADEVMTYSLLNRDLLEAVHCVDKGVAEVRNPISNEQEVMRPTLVIGMLNAIRWNINRKARDLRIFELGNIYHKDGHGAAGAEFAESLSLCIGLTGHVSSGWVGGSREANFFDLKGVVESLLGRLGVADVSVKELKHALFSAGASAQIEIGHDTVGVMGHVEPAILDAFDIKNTVYLATICVEGLLKHIRMEKRFKELAKYPSVVRDISLIVDTSLTNENVLSVIKNAGGALLVSIALIDRYVGKQIPQGKASLTYRLEYQDTTKTLEDKDIAAVHSKILAELESACAAKLRETA